MQHSSFFVLTTGVQNVLQFKEVKKENFFFFNEWKAHDHLLSHPPAPPAPVIHSFAWKEIASMSIIARVQLLHQGGIWGWGGQVVGFFGVGVEWKILRYQKKQEEAPTWPRCCFHDNRLEGRRGVGVLRRWSARYYRIWQGTKAGLFKGFLFRRRIFFPWRWGIF